jgi:tRNA(Arg) A34 adenosine deaminase TadA
MPTKLSKFDKECLRKAIDVAAETLKIGTNYPVGAVLCIDNQIIDIAGNEINRQKSFVKHAENTLIIRNDTKLFNASKAGKAIALYSTLEPCIQCLGACVTNKVNKLFYIQKDPNGGACDLQYENIGLRYREFWPEIIHAPISKTPKKLMVAYFNTNLKNGTQLEWSTKMLRLLKDI